VPKDDRIIGFASKGAVQLVRTQMSTARPIVFSIPPQSAITMKRTRDVRWRAAQQLVCHRVFELDAIDQDQVQVLAVGTSKSHCELVLRVRHRSEFDNALDLPSVIKGNNGQVLTFKYDAVGNAKETTDAAGRTTLFSYDELNRLTTQTNPDGGVIINTYSPAGFLASVKDPRGLVTSYTYNGFGDVLSVPAPIPARRAIRTIWRGAS
jgi:YD repeat-containing protein